MPDTQAKLQARIDEAIKLITDALTELGLNVVRIEPCKEPQRIRDIVEGGDNDELMPHFAGGHFNGWFQISAQEGNFKMGFVGESIPAIDLLDTGVTIKDIIGSMPKDEEDEDIDDNDLAHLDNFIPLMDGRVLETFVRLFKNRKGK